MMRRDGDSPPPDGVLAAVAGALAAHVSAGEPVAVALSGGRDSVVLLDALCRVAPDARASGCRRCTSTTGSRRTRTRGSSTASRCAPRAALPLAVRAVAVPRAPQTSLEAEARRLRYAALGDAAVATDVRFVALAHHRDDQAETLLLQLLRGAGPHGLAGMAAAHADPRGVTFVRPLLDVPRSAIDAYASAGRLALDRRRQQRRCTGTAATRSALVRAAGARQRVSAAGAHARARRAAPGRRGAPGRRPRGARRRAGRARRPRRSTARRSPRCRRTARATCCAGSCGSAACPRRRPRAWRRCWRSSPARAATRT